MTASAVVSSTFQKRPCYRYIRETDKMPLHVPYDAPASELIARVRLFNPTGIGTWWLASVDEMGEIAYGVAELFEREMGSIYLPELVDFRGRFGLPIERDLHFSPCSLADVLAGGR